MINLYEYKVIDIVKVYDGDTITAIIDLGFNTLRKENLRLSYIDAPEIKGEERPSGLVSRDWLRDRIDRAKLNSEEIYIKTSKDKKGKYGRYIAELFISGENINETLISAGLAEYKKY